MPRAYLYAVSGGPHADTGRSWFLASLWKHRLAGDNSDIEKLQLTTFRLAAAIFTNHIHHICRHNMGYGKPSVVIHEHSCYRVVHHFTTADRKFPYKHFNIQVIDLQPFSNAWIMKKKSRTEHNFKEKKRKTNKTSITHSKWHCSWRNTLTAEN